VGYTTWVALHRLSCLTDNLTANKLLTLQIQERIASNTGVGRAKSPTLLVIDIPAVIISLNQTIYTCIEPEEAHAVGNNNEHIPLLPNEEIAAVCLGMYYHVNCFVDFANSKSMLRCYRYSAVKDKQFGGTSSDELSRKHRRVYS